MPRRTIDEQLTKYLADAHSIGEQTLQQLRMAPAAAGDSELAAMLREHLGDRAARAARPPAPGGTRRGAFEGQGGRDAGRRRRVRPLRSRAARHARQARLPRFLVRAPGTRGVRAARAGGRARRRRRDGRGRATNSRGRAAHGRAPSRLVGHDRRRLSARGDPPGPRQAAEQVPRGRPRDRGSGDPVARARSFHRGRPRARAPLSPSTSRRRAISRSSCAGASTRAAEAPRN